MTESNNSVSHAYPKEMDAKHPRPWRVEWNPDNDGRRVSDANGDCVAAWTWVACYPSGAVFDGMDEEDAQLIVDAINALPAHIEVYEK